MGLQPLYRKGPLPLPWAGSQAARANITISGAPNLLNCCVIFTVYTQFTNLSASRGLETHELAEIDGGTVETAVIVKFKTFRCTVVYICTHT
jgi:hypothetical protein